MIPNPLNSYFKAFFILPFETIVFANRGLLCIYFVNIKQQNPHEYDILGDFIFWNFVCFRKMRHLCATLSFPR